MPNHTVSISFQEVGRFSKKGRWFMKFNATIDNLLVPVEAYCRRTGRTTAFSQIFDDQLINQVAWCLTFDNPEVKNHPDYPQIRREILRLLLVSPDLIRN
jgi:hypothetical protein